MQARYFFIMNFDLNARSVLSEYFEEMSSFADMKEPHFTLLYLPDFLQHETTISEFFLRSVPLMSQMKIQVLSGRCSDGFLILDAVKSDALKKIHQNILNQKPDEVECENSCFERWDPHFGIGKIKDCGISEKMMQCFNSAAEELKQYQLGFESMLLTRRMNGQFKTLESVNFI